MRPQGKEIVEFHDTVQKERGFNCMELVRLLTEDEVTDWGRWHGAHLQASSGECPYKTVCSIYERTNLNTGNGQLSLNYT